MITSKRTNQTITFHANGTAYYDNGTDASPAQEALGLVNVRGNYTSPLYTIEAGGSWSNITLEREIPTGTDFGVQVRTCPNASCDSVPFIGPDNASGSYLKDTLINLSSLNLNLTNRHLQLKVYMNATATNITPKLFNVTINHLNLTARKAVIWGSDASSPSYSDGYAEYDNGYSWENYSSEVDHSFEVYNDNFDITGNLTIGAWVRLSTSQTGYRYLIAKHNAWGIIINRTNIVIINNTGSWWNTDFNITPNEWHHIVAVYDISALIKKLYIDGLEKTNTTQNSSLINNENLLTLAGLNQDRKSVV